jgi:hypothetical protein
MIDRNNFDKLERLREDVLASIKGIGFGDSDTLEIQVEFVAFVHRLIEREFRVPVITPPPIVTPPPIAN